MTQKAVGEALERNGVSPMKAIDQAKQREKQTNPPPRGRRAPSSERPLAQPKSKHIHPPELRLKLVKLYLEEGIPAAIISRESGINGHTIRYWVRLYRRLGEAGLKGTNHPRGPKPDTGVHTAIIAAKRKHPEYGIQKLAHLLKRMLFLPVSRETVRRTLHREKLMAPAKKKTRRNPSKPRFFERSTPNQMWQSDIFPFKLLGSYAYLIGFIDDHSRYITALEVFRSQTSENVLEVYRRGAGAYGVPREMLTDNGRQYVSWRGRTAFVRELEKDRVHHIRSAPHHPMTLGKIERFWKTIWEEFLSRAQFADFESARERIGWWIKYYNHQRPHQGIEGLCPADRFFAIQKELRLAMEAGMEANIQELALRGRVAKPVYLVGRVGDQSLIIRSERGALQMNVENHENREENNDESGKQRNGTDSKQDETESAGASGAGEMPGSVKRVGAETAREHGVPGVGDQLGHLEPMGKAGDPGHAGGPGAEGDVRGTAGELGAEAGAVTAGTGAFAGRRASERVSQPVNHEESENEKSERGNEAFSDGAVSGGIERVDGTANYGKRLPGTGAEAVPINAVAGAGNEWYGEGVVAARSAGGAQAGAGDSSPASGGADGGGERGATAAVGQAAGAGGGSPAGGDRGVNHALRVVKEEWNAERCDRPATGGTDHPSAQRESDGQSGSTATGGFAQDLLQVGTAGPGGDVHGVERTGERSSGA